jgi:hypothetical protein
MCDQRLARGTPPALPKRMCLFGPEIEKAFHRHDRSIARLQRRLLQIARAPEHRMAALAVQARDELERAKRSFEPLRRVLPRHMIDTVDRNLCGLGAELEAIIADGAPN